MVGLGHWTESGGASHNNQAINRLLLVCLLSAINRTSTNERVS